HDDLLILQTLSRDFYCAQDRAEGDCRRALNVIVESQQLITIMLKQGPRVWSRKVLPLQTGVREFLLHCLNELIDEVVIDLTGHPFMSPAEIFRVIQSFLIVGSHIQNDGQRSFWTNPTYE